MALGDRNTKYFHNQASTKRRINQIKALRLDDGLWCFDKERLKYEALSFYQKLYTYDSVSMGRYPIRNMFPPIVSEFLDVLGRTVTVDEVHDTFFGMEPLKVPRINGLHVHFYQS